MIFYLLYLLKGYAALSWLGAFTCVATVVLIAGQGTRVSAALAIIAVGLVIAPTNRSVDSRAEFRNPDAGT